MELSEEDPWYEIDIAHEELLNHQPPILHTISKKNLNPLPTSSVISSQLKLKQSQMLMHDINCKSFQFINI